MRAATIFLVALFSVIIDATNDLNKSPGTLISEENAMSGEYDVVVYIGDSYKNMAPELRSIQDAILSYAGINPGVGKTLSVIPYPEHPCRKLIWADTGDLSSDVASSRDIRFIAEKAMHRVHKLGFERVLIIVGEMQTALPNFDWAFGIYPKMTAALGALHALYKPLQVREMVGPEPKVEKLGLYKFTERLLNFVGAVGAGMGVTRDIGDSDPERTAPPKIVEYLKARQTDWERAGIVMTIDDVLANAKKYPFCAVVNRATTDVPRHHGKVVTVAYKHPTSLKPTGQTLIFVGKGITLDTGGADLKINGIMYGMHSDKLGAAFVAGIFHVISMLQPEGLEAMGYMPFIRNSIGARAYLPDEIVYLANGIRVRVGNTDSEGRNILADVLYYARNEAIKRINPHIFTIATLTGAAGRAFGPYTVTMDNGPAYDANTARKLMKSGDMIGDPTEVARIRYEDFKPNFALTEWEDVQQYNTNGGTSTRGFSFPMGFLEMTSMLDKNGRNSAVPVKYTHCDIAGSAGGINELATAAPLRMFSLNYLWDLTK